MPIYAYRCASCGHAKDVLQKVSDAPLTVCPACGAEAMRKQVTAAGFQLKGSGWYVTDFRGGGTAAPTGAASDAKDPKDAKNAKDAKPADKDAPAATPAPAAGSAATAAAPSPAPAPAPTGPASSTS
jgi:putative FmdB family regulatory protein